MDNKGTVPAPPTRTRGSATTRSTAGPGYDFEDQVGADLLSRALVGEPAPGTNIVLTSLLSQTSAIGWHVDDLVLVGSQGQLALSCKSSVQVTASGFPSDFSALAWAQWRGGAPFDRNCDHIALATRGSHATFSPLWADLKTWCADGGSDLALGRIRGSQAHDRIFSSLLNAGPADATEAEAMALVARLHVLPFTFQLEPSQSRIDGIERCRRALASTDREDAERLWEMLVATVRDARVGAGEVRSPPLWNSLRSRFRLKDHPDLAGDWSILRAYSDDHLATVDIQLPSGHRIVRSDDMSLLATALDNDRWLVVAGDSGVGKSAIVRNLLENHFPDASPTWIAPDALADLTSEVERRRVGFGHPLLQVLMGASAPEPVLVLDAAERIDLATAQRAAKLLGELRNQADTGLRVILISQPDALRGALRPLVAVLGVAIHPLGTLDAADVRTALQTVPALRWIAAEASMVDLLLNPRMLAMVMGSASSFTFDERQTLASPTTIADKIWERWVAGKTVLGRLLIRLAEREARFERSFAASELDSGDASAFDSRPDPFPLILDHQHRLSFSHDLATDLIRYQRLKEIGNDVSLWGPFGQQPLWLPALRLFGQYLLRQSVAGQNGWDRAFAAAQAAGDVGASDVLLDSLCLDPHADQFIQERRPLLLANDAALFNRLVQRFITIASTADLPVSLADETGLRVHIEATMRRPIYARWWAFGRFLEAHLDEIGGLGSSVVARLAMLWLKGTPLTLQGGQPIHLRMVFARLALATAQTVYAQNRARGWTGGHGETVRAVYAAALAGAPDLPDEVAAFALKAARRRQLDPALAARIDTIRAADNARMAALREDPETEALRMKRARAASLASMPVRRTPLPPWPDGPDGRLQSAFRDAVLHDGGLNHLMRIRPAEAVETLLACLIDDRPREQDHYSLRLEDEVGLASDSESHPTAFWKSPFFLFLQIDRETALETLIKLVDFCTKRSVGDMAAGARPAVTIELAGGPRTYTGTWRSFGWSEQNSMSCGQLYAALDALERWLCLSLEAGEDVAPVLNRLLRESNSLAILGVLVNIGKYRPQLFATTLAPLLEAYQIYFLDEQRVQAVNYSFVAYGWARAGEFAFNMVRDWRLAPHHKETLRAIILRLCHEDPALATRIGTAASGWVSLGDVNDFDLRILKAELDPANHRGSGEQPEVAYPDDLVLEAQQRAADATPKREAILLPQQCEEVIGRGGTLTEESCEYLASLLPAGDGADGDDEARDTGRIAAAATLIVIGDKWLAERPEIALRARSIISGTIARVGSTLAELRSADLRFGNDPLRFAGYVVVKALLADDPDAPEWALTILTSREVGAIAPFMRACAAQRDALGSRWPRLLELGMMAAALSAVTPDRAEDGGDDLHWNRWLAWLRRQSVDRPASGRLTPVRLSQAVERLCQSRRRRLLAASKMRAWREGRLSAGIHWHIVRAVFIWLFEDAPAQEDAACRAGRAEHLAALWTNEVWRLDGRIDDDGASGLPSELGYEVVQAMPELIVELDETSARCLWEPVFAMGSDGHVAIDQLISSWFLLIGKAPPVEKLIPHWAAMMDSALAADWPSERRGYRGRRMLQHLLGLTMSEMLAAHPDHQQLIAVLEPRLEHWASRHLKHDNDAISALAYFLTKDVAQHFLSKGIIWIAAALADGPSLRAREGGDALAELVDKALTRHSDLLLAKASCRDAVISIVACLVASQIPTAIDLQTRLGSLR